MKVYTLSEWNKQKKKKNENDNESGELKVYSYAEWAEKKGVKPITSSKKKEDDIAPVRTGSGGKRREDIAPTKKRTWFEKGAFEDGYQFGDVTKTILGTARDTDENVMTGILGMGEKAVDALAQLAPAFNAAQQSQYNPTYAFDIKEYRKQQADMADFVAKDLYNEEELAKKAPISILGNIAKQAGIEGDENSVFGEKSDALAQSGGQLAATAILSPVVPWYMTTGLTSFGSAAEEAYKEGATHDEATGSALISAGAEILSERLGGISFGGKTLTDKMLKPLTGQISSKVLKHLANFGVEGTAEGLEEIFSSAVSNLGNTLYNDKNAREALLSEEALDEYLESFIGGMVLGGGSSVLGSVAGGEKVEYTENEQKVIDKVVEKRIAEQEVDGVTLSKREKAAIEERVKHDLEKGYIDIDDIESAIGGETYDSYKSETEYEEKLQKEYAELNKLKPLEMTGEQTDRRAELKQQLEELKNNSKATQIKQQLSQEVSEMAKSDRLVESYNEKQRGTQKFDAADIEYKSEAGKKTIDNIVNSGLVNNQNRSKDFVNLLVRVSDDKGYVFNVSTTAKLEESKKNGNVYEIGKNVNTGNINALVNKNTNEIVINLDSGESLNSLAGHEITHTLEIDKYYDPLQEALIAYAKTKGEYDGRMESIRKRYKGDEAFLMKEFTAEALGDYLFTDSEFVNNLSANHRNVFQRIYDEIKYLCKVATAGSKELRELERVKHLFEKAYRDSSEMQEAADVETKFSIREEAPPKETGIAYKVFFVKDGKLYPPMVANPDGADTPMGVWLNADVGTAAPPSKTGRAQVKAGGKGTQGGSGSLAFRPGWHLGDLPRASQFDRVNPETGKKELFPENFVWAEVEYAKDVDYQEEAMSYGYTENGKFRHSYAGLPRLPENGYYRYRTNPNPETVPWVITGAMKVNRLLSDAEVNSILEKNGIEPVHRQGGDVGLDKFGFNVDGSVKYSISEADNAYLEAAKNRDFETAQKMVDEAAAKAGYTKVVYHGTDARFTSFDTDAISPIREDHQWAADYPKGTIFLAESGEDAEAYGNRTMDLLLDTSDIKVFEEPNMSAAQAMDSKYGNEVNNYPVIAVKGNDTTIYATLDNTLVKSMDAVTYDDNGEIIPLSERFKHDNEDIRFSLSEPVEETKELVAVHNLTSEKLLKTLKLGGLPMPSIAIAKAKDGHSEFGEISLVLNKDAIDPKTSRNNKMYSGDAWTPTYPTIEYKANETVRRKIQDKVIELVPYEVQKELGNIMLDSDNIRDTLNRYNGDMVDAFKSNDSMKYAYLKDSGIEIELPLKEADLYLYGKVSNNAVRYFSGKLVNGLQTIEKLRKMPSRELSADNELKEAIADTLNFDVLRNFEAGTDNYTKLKNNPIYSVDKVTFAQIDNMLIAAKKLLTNGIQQTLDRKAAGETIRNAVDQTSYEKWLKEQFSGIVEKEGIRNNKDTFTPSGNRRSFEALHYEHNLENVIKAMRETGEKGIGGFGDGNIFGASTKEFASIEEMKKSTDRLQNLSEEEISEIKKGFSERFFELANTLPNNKNSFSATDDAANMMIEAISKYNTRNGIANYIKRESQGWATYSDQVVDDLIELVNDIRNMPTGYFEAKPQRAVSLDEVGVFIIPNNADVKLKQELLNRGYNIAEYDPDVEGSRTKVLNQFEDYMFSLADAGKGRRKVYGDYNVYGKDIRLKENAAPIVPVQENTPVKETAPKRNLAEIAPMTELDAYLRDARTENEHYFPDDMPMMEDEETYNGEFSNHIKPDDPFYEKDIWEVGKDRSQKAYMYENPEVKPYFQEEARYMLGELDNSSKGEKFYNDQLYYDTNGEMGFFGTKRHTSDEIAYLLDSFNYTYKDVAKGLRAIIEDNGKENNAISKRIEFLLDERLRLGYRDFWTGDRIPPNQGYINLLNEKQITEYNDEAFSSWVGNLTEEEIQQYFSLSEQDEVAPMPNYVPVEETVAPMQEYEAIRPKRSTDEPRMARVKNAEVDNKDVSPVAQILTEEPKAEKKKSRFWSQAMELVGDKGFVFENLSKKTKNRELEAKWNFIRYADGKAQDFIGNGADGVKSLKDVQAEVEKAGLTKQLYEYVYHLHNIDRMSLENRYDDVPNKAVFGDSVTSEISKREAAKLESQYPALKKYAQEIYNINDYLRNLLVEGGVISQETADLWKEMYPHYVPIRRAGEHGLNINVPLDTRKTGINAPVKKATGGSSDILPLFDTMAQRALQTYKAVAKNRFGVELKNALGTTIGAETAGVDSVIDGLDNSEELLQKGKNGKNPTFTVFENGEKVTFEITDDMYDALKPTSETLKYTNKVANAVSNFHRNVLTQYNPAFLASNAIKDVQDVLINSQHPVKTYAAFPKAMWEMTRNGKLYQEYVKNGGEQNTYFDRYENSFVKEKSRFEKAIGMPLSIISNANNIVERTPRLAEYIASREAGRSIEVSMLDSARVTTNFAAGGDFTKFLNRNGATFLNASVQGAMQQVRNVREAKMNGLKGWTQLATKYAIAGLPAVLLNGLLWDDDEEYEELSDYVKQNYYVVAKYGDGKFVRIPKGRTLAVIQNAFEQTMNALTGDDEVDLNNFLQLAVSNLSPNNPIEDNILAPIIQAKNNETWYGGDLVPTRLQDLPAEEQFDESTDSISRWLGEKLKVSPYKINYLLDQYTGGVGDTFLPMLTPEAENGEDTWMGNITAPIRDKFTTDSVLKNQNVSDFYDTSDTLTTNAKRSGATDEDILANKYFNSVKTDIGKLYAEKREIQNSDLSDSEKYYLVRDIQKQINALAKEALSEHENVNIDGVYSTVGDRQYRHTDEGWQKLSADDIEKQDEVTSGLGITPSEYWSNKEEYDYAYKEPGKHAISKVVGGYDTYTTYKSALNDIKADKDSSGKTINGSAKEKKTEYINNLDLDYGQRIILYRSLFDSQKDKEAYNEDIVDYLNSRSDISYEEMVKILTELDMTVNEDGSISW